MRKHPGNGLTPVRIPRPVFENRDHFSDTETGDGGLGLWTKRQNTETPLFGYGDPSMPDLLNLLNPNFPNLT